MKLHYTNILLFSLPLNILAHSKNKTYITPHKRTTTSRVLSECYINTLIYDKDPDMKSVKENFDRQTSQRFEEYEERMSKKRQKYKEQCDKDIQEIISKEKIEKSLAEKMEKGCLICACGLGGGVAPVWGLVSGLWYGAWTNYVAGVAAKAAIDAGVKEAIKGLGNIYELGLFSYLDLSAVVTPTNYDKQMKLVAIVSDVYNMCFESTSAQKTLFCSSMKGMGGTSTLPLQTISEMAAGVATDARQAAETAEAAQIALTNAAGTHLYSAIVYSAIAILIILSVMVIIYLILRYRRKKKINKKMQYTKLLNQ
ncbi:PIR protein, putative [Plasmodium sp. gorilla clade G1]|nr:PIR protein, putative [Plasmodium sp. gorilla clade G1]